MTSGTVPFKEGTMPCLQPQKRLLEGARRVLYSSKTAWRQTLSVMPERNSLGDSGRDRWVGQWVGQVGGTVGQQIKGQVDS